MSLRISGSYTALATPFRGGAFDEETYAKHIEFQLANGTSGLIPIGTTGEASTMNAAERKRAVQLCVEVGKRRVPVFAGAGSFSTVETIENVRAVRDVGADGALIVTPYYNKPTQSGLVEHYKLIAKAHPGFPIMVYNVPSRTSVDVLPDTVKRLADIKEVVALKEATGLMPRALEIYELVGDAISLMTGDDFTVAPFIACGGRGVVSVSSNIVPKQMAELCAAALASDVAKARTIQNKLQPLHRQLFVESNPIPLKRALFLMGRFADEIRPPLFPMSDANTPALEQELRRQGLLTK